MSEPKFTPGPWVVDAWTGSDDYEDPDIPFVEIGGVRWQPHEVEVPCAFQQRYDAALIAAAPELYAVAQRHVEYLLAELSRMGQPTAGHICGPEGNCDSDCEARYYLTSDLEAARAALAKARGEK